MMRTESSENGFAGIFLAALLAFLSASAGAATRNDVGELNLAEKWGVENVTAEKLADLKGEVFLKVTLSLSPCSSHPAGTCAGPVGEDQEIHGKGDLLAYLREYGA